MKLRKRSIDSSLRFNVIENVPGEEESLLK